MVDEKADLAILHALEAVKLMELRESDLDLYAELSRDIRARPFGAGPMKPKTAAIIEDIGGDEEAAEEGGGEDDDE